MFAKRIKKLRRISLTWLSRTLEPSNRHISKAPNFLEHTALAILLHVRDSLALRHNWIAAKYSSFSHLPFIKATDKSNVRLRNQALFTESHPQLAMEKLA
jgi:hypothetical protein